MSGRKPKKRRWLLALAALLLLPFVVPEQPRIPVEGATTRDWNPQSFWYEPWGKSGACTTTHISTTPPQACRWLGPAAVWAA